MEDNPTKQNTDGKNGLEELWDRAHAHNAYDLITRVIVAGGVRVRVREEEEEVGCEETSEYKIDPS